MTSNIDTLPPKNVQVVRNTSIGSKIPITNDKSHLSKENTRTVVQEPDGHIWGEAEGQDVFQE